VGGDFNISPSDLNEVRIIHKKGASVINAAAYTITCNKIEAKTFLVLLIFYSSESILQNPLASS
jgi:UDP-N-acetylglucosamine enolpyruvyl transferase